MDGDSHTDSEIRAQPVVPEVDGELSDTNAEENPVTVEEVPAEPERRSRRGRVIRSTQRGDYQYK